MYGLAVNLIMSVSGHLSIINEIPKAFRCYIHSPQKCLVHLDLYGVKWP